MTWLPSGLRKASTLYLRVWIGLHDLGVVQVYVELVGTAMGEVKGLLGLVWIGLPSDDW